MTDATAPMGASGAANKSLGPRPPITLFTKLAYGFGSIAYGVKDNGFRVFLLVFYNQVVGMDAGTVSLAILVAMLIDCAIDPIIGQYSDNLRSRWGRRHPLMYFSALPAAASFLLLWSPPFDWSQGALFWYLVGVAVLVRSFITLYEIPSGSLGAELTLDYNERTSLQGYRYFFGWWGGLTLVIAMNVFFLKATPEYPVAQLNRDGYAQWSYVAAIVMFISILLSAWGTHKFIPWLRTAHGHTTPNVFEQLSDMKAALSNRSFICITLVGLLAAVAQGVAFSLAFYFATYFWQLTPGQTAIITADAYISSALALMAAPYLSKRSGKKMAGQVLLMTAVLVGFIPLALRLIGFFPDNGSPWLVPLLFADGVIRGVFSITAAILITSMLVDVVEDAAVKTGKRQEGLFFAFTSLVQKAVSGVGVLVAGFLLTTIEFPKGAAPSAVDPDIIRNLALVYMPVIIGFYGLAVIVLQFYNITREKHEENVRQLRLAELKLQEQVVEQAASPRYP